MRQSKIAARIRNQEPIRLAMMGHFIPSFIAYAAHAGYDGIWLDLEHRAMDAREIQALLAFFRVYDIDCLLRPPSTDKAQLYRYLEDGATGLMMPQVSGVAAARELVQKIKFPPVGDRGIEGRGFETDFGLTGDQAALVAHAHTETLLAVQIETPQALAEVEAIAALEGVDLLFVGPSDLGLRLPHLPESERLTLEEAYQQVAAAAARYNKPWGSMPRTLDHLEQFKALGARIQVWGNDITLLRNGLAQAADDLKKLTHLS